MSLARPVLHLRLPGRFPEGAGHFEGCEWPGVSCSGGQISHRDRLPGGLWPRSARPSGQLSYQHNVPLRSCGMASSTVQGRIPAASPGARCHVRAGAVLRRLPDRQGVMWRCGSWSEMLRWCLSLTTWRLGVVGLLADQGCRYLTEMVLGSDQERALRQAVTAAVVLTAAESGRNPNDDGEKPGSKTGVSACAMAC